MFPFTNNCHKCGKDIPSGVVFHWVRSAENPDVQTECATCFKAAKLAAPNHWTFPEDPEEKAGWGIFNFDWLLKPMLSGFVQWHDRVTTKGSYAQKIGIPVWRISKAGKEMLEVMCQNKPWYDQVKCEATRFVTEETNPYFYEGPLGEDDIFRPKVKEDPESGEMH